MATIYDIAERAGVSTATVSRVLNGSARVAKATREQVEQAAQALNYRPHVSAKNLARQKAEALSVVIPVMANDFYVSVLRGMQEALEQSETDLDLIVFAASNPDQVSEQIHRASQRGRSDGLFLLSMMPSEEQEEHLRASDLPLVLVDTDHSEFDSVALDNVLGGRVATAHLIEQGYERIGHITVPPEGSLTAAQRRRGYEEALHEAGRAADESLIVERGDPPYEFREEWGRAAMAALLERKPRPDAVFAVSDVLALGALKATEEAGVSVPGDVALIGFDDIRVSQYIGLSTVRQPMREMGQVAVDKMLGRLRNASRPPSSTVFDPTLVARRTSMRA